MEEAIKDLQGALELGEELYKDLRDPIPESELKEFAELCKQFVELRTKYLVLQKIADESPIEEYDERELEELNRRREKMEEEIKELQQMRVNTEESPEKLQELIKKGRSMLNEVNEKSALFSGKNINDIGRLAQEEMENINKTMNAYDWYDSAYKKLSEFSGIHIIDNNTIQVLGTHNVFYTSNSIRVEPSDIYIGDLDVSEEDLRLCVSTIIERLNALKNLKDIALKLNMNLEQEFDAPVVKLVPKNGKATAVFALMGYDNHPLIEWGSIDINEFNDSKMPLIEKIRKGL